MWQRVSLDFPGRPEYAGRAVTIRLNGDDYALPEPVSVRALLDRLDIDPRRVAVEHNLIVVRRATYDSTVVREGDHVEIVNFVGGG